MKTKDNVVELENPGKSIVNDTLTTFIKESAQKMLITAIEAEVNEFIMHYEDHRLSNGHQRVVRNGYQPERILQTGVGGIKVKLPRVRDRGEYEGEKIIFHSHLIPKYMRRTATLDVLLPILYLKGISTGDFSEALMPMLGEQAKSISPSVISRLKEGWYDDYLDWQKRDLSTKNYIYWWVDGIYTSIRAESEKICMLVIVGATQEGKKELVGLVDGFRESAESWSEVLMDLKNRGLTSGAKLAVGDGALGFWKAVAMIYPKTRHQRCWVHKTSNVLDKLPTSQQAKAKSLLHDIYLAATKQEALTAFDKFISHFQLKYSKAVECLIKDKAEMLAFYDFPAEHWQHIRTTNPIESTFSTIRHRTKKSRGCFSRETIIACVFKLACEAEKRWKRLYGYKRLAEVVNLVQFIDGVSEHEINQNKLNLEAA